MSRRRFKHLQVEGEQSREDWGQRFKEQASSSKSKPAEQPTHQGRLLGGCKPVTRAANSAALSRTSPPPPPHLEVFAAAVVQLKDRRHVATPAPEGETMPTVEQDAPQWQVQAGTWQKSMWKAAAAQRLRASTRQTACCDAAGVCAPVAVVGCRPDSHQLVLKHPLVALHDQLVGTRNELNLPRQDGRVGAVSRAKRDQLRN